ncbi:MULTISPECIES: hypothetical protein [Nonomuraea]|uniref:WXG100 family type VII secretion target n=1 Tax=Nonomuraea mangrovi TaxID=2316207 RepID=A0ABW4SQZ4_9ACTN
MPIEHRWPGLDPKPGEIEYSADKLKGIAKALNDGLERLTGMEIGSMQDLTSRGMVTHPAPNQGWEAGDAVFDTISEAHRFIMHVYGEINLKYGTALSLVNAGAGVYNGTEQINTGTKSV